MTVNLQEIIVEPNLLISSVLKIIDSGGLGLCLVANNNKLLGIVTDGDVRRGILKGVNLTEPVNMIMNKSPLTAHCDLSSQEIQNLMQKRKIYSLPLINNKGHIVGIKTLYDVLNIEKKDNPVFIMAGGFGTRLKPLTDNCPKPMLEVAGKPMLRRLIDNFKSKGFYKFYISTHYLPKVIMDYFGDGSSLNIEITYIYEENPLGTGGALSLLPESLPNHPVIVINGDILTNVDFIKVLDFHNKYQNDATMCVRNHEINIPFGVIEGDGFEITAMVEKPSYRYFVNAGIYVISNEIIKSLPINEHLDMPNLFEIKQKEGFKILKFPIHEYWLDIGRHDDFKKAQIDISQMDFTK